MRRVNSNDAGALHALGTCYYNGELGLRFAAGFSKSHYNLSMNSLRLNKSN
jgi:hypothetical protein